MPSDNAWCSVRQPRKKKLEENENERPVQERESTTPQTNLFLVKGLLKPTRPGHLIFQTATDRPPLSTHQVIHKLGMREIVNERELLCSFGEDDMGVLVNHC